MATSSKPWIGLLALAAMFVLPYLPDKLFCGPRTIKHYPRRHVCAECGVPWVEGHICAADTAPAGLPIHGELRRVDTTSALTEHPRSTN
jgi:hypothetical protein